MRAAEPHAAVSRALSEYGLVPESRPWIVAIGKASAAMAGAAVDALRAAGAGPAGGVIVAPEACSSPHAAISVSVGDHPVPGARSFQSSLRIAEIVARVDEDDDVLVLLSGGGSSLAAAPAPGVSERDLVTTFDELLASGLDVRTMNDVRRVVTRWGGGRLAESLDHARITALVVSDVIDGDVGDVASGPCSPVNDRSLRESLRCLRARGVLARLPARVRAKLAVAARGRGPAARDRRHAVLGAVSPEVIASLDDAISAAFDEMLRAGVCPHLPESPVTGLASEAGGAIVRELLALPAEPNPICLIVGGEPVVELTGAPPDARGGRCQELALAAARELRAHEERNVTLLAAGTDGRDGPTDAAGAIVNGSTWERIGLAGRDPAADLSGHRSYDALDAAGALLRTGLTGTNVNDVILALRMPPSR